MWRVARNMACQVKLSALDLWTCGDGILMSEVLLQNALDRTMCLMCRFRGGARFKV